MEYKKGHKIKPKETLINGVVVFTDGTNDVAPSQLSCEAYGYRWNRSNNTCYGFASNFKINKLFQNTTNTKIGAENKTERGTTNTLINGQENTTKGNNRNLLISGENNQVNNGINNATVLGTYGQAFRQAEVVIGGADSLGIKQMSFVQLSGKTSDSTVTDLSINGNYIEVQNNSIMGFETKVIGLVSGGSAGTAGDYIYAEITGAVQVDDGFNLTFSQTSTTIASVGTTGTVQMAAVTSPYISVEVTGTENINIEWFASVKITENKLEGVTF